MPGLEDCTLDTCPVEYSILGYRPSLAASITFIVLHLLLLAVHFFLGLRLKAWWFASCMILGCAANIVGYAARILLYYDPFNFNSFLIQIVFVGSAPVFYTAAIYVTMARTVEYFDASLSRIKPKLYYIIFIGCDILALVLQAAGGALSSIGDAPSGVGVDLALAGLVFQVVTMVVFSALLADYLARYFMSRPGFVMDRQLKMFLGFLSFAIFLILARCAYRVAELSEGYNGDIFHDEPLFIGLEGVLIVIAVIALCIAHPGAMFNQELDRTKLTSKDGGESGTELMVEPRV
ncbi:parasitic phase-specific protein PSP-1 [Poronia punctata]|nr:parasitic phase-specific protein PSP-1 [Poronia punctata]